MKSTKDSGFLLLAIVIAAVLAAAAYFLLISPALTAKGEAAAAQEAAAVYNDTLEIQLAQYQKASEELPQTKAAIADIRVELAPQEDVAAIRRLIDPILVEETLTKVSDSVSIAAVVVPGSVFLQPSAAAVGRTSYTDALVFNNLYATSMEMEVKGTITSVMRAVAKLQMHEDRFLLVQGLSTEEDTEAGPGFVTARIQLYFFTLLDPSGIVDPGTNSTNVDPVTGDKQPDLVLGGG